MQRMPPESDILPEHQRKSSNLWDKIKRKNASSPSLHKVGFKNWSTRSLPRLGSVWSSTVGGSSGPRPKSNSIATPIEDKYCIYAEPTPKKEEVIKDYFSGLPNEVKLQILSHLPAKMIARASAVRFCTCNSNR